MSIEELSKSVDLLAKAVGEKSKELDQLKQVYEAKIRKLDDAFASLLEAVRTVERNGKSNTGASVNLEEYENDITCPHCQNIILNNDSYIRVPIARLTEEAKQTEAMTDVFKKLNVGTKSNENIYKNAGENTKGKTVETINPRSNELISESTSTDKLLRKKGKGKGNIICSFCKKPGHTRAKCKVRLSTPVS